MKFNGQLTVKALRAEVFKAVRDARFFASCVDGVRDLQETAPHVYAAVFETKVAYMKFPFKVSVEVVRAEPTAGSRPRSRHPARHCRQADRDGADPAQPRPVDGRTAPGSATRSRPP